MGFLLAFVVVRVGDFSFGAFVEVFLSDRNEFLFLSYLMIPRMHSPILHTNISIITSNRKL